MSNKPQYRDKPRAIASVGTFFVILLALGDFDTAATYIGLSTIVLVVSAMRHPRMGVNHRTVFVLGLVGLIVGFVTACLVTLTLAATVTLTGFAVMWRSDVAPGPNYRRTGGLAA